MKLTYAATVRFPTEKAHGLQIASMCQAFRRAGAEVTLVVPRRRQVNDDLKKISWERFYGVRKKFAVVKLPCLDTLWIYWGSEKVPAVIKYLGYLLLKASFYLSFCQFLLAKRKCRLIYTRELGLALIGKFMGRQVFVEQHDIPRTRLGNLWFFWIAGKIANGLVVTNSGFYRHILRQGLAKEKILLAPNAVDRDFLQKRNKMAARRKLKLPLQKKLAIFVGSIQPYEGIETVLLTAKLLSDKKDVRLLLLGKAPSLAKQRLFNRRLAGLKLNNLDYLGYKQHVAVPDYLAAADLLLIPFSRRYMGIHGHFLSPLKAYEYMASRRPVVAAGLLGLRKIFVDGSAVFFKSDSPTSLAAKIKLVLADSELAATVARRAYRLVAGRTWDDRAEKIIGFVNP